jgi:hypothetical protein
MSVTARLGHGFADREDLFRPHTLDNARGQRQFSALMGNEFLQSRPLTVSFQHRQTSNSVLVRRVSMFG